MQLHGFTKDNEMRGFFKALACAVMLGFAGVQQGGAADTISDRYGAQFKEREGFVKVGLLSCTSEGGFGYILGSSKDLVCEFENYRGAQELETYVGKLTKIGADIGYTKDAVLVWGVYSPSYQYRDGKLDGTYVGLSAEATLGVGAGANILVGSFNNSINLVPLSISTQLGLNIAGGIGAISLASN